MTMDPTARGDEIASKIRCWYEANRESWWARHRPFAPSPDRDGTHADEFILRLIGAVRQAEEETPK